MKSVASRFLIPLGILAVLSSVFIFYQTYESSRKHAYELIRQQAALALEFNLAIRSYAGESIRPFMEKFVDKDTFIPETMSTSFISRRIFEKVKKKFPGDIIRFSSDNPRNPFNSATADELRMIDYFGQNPQVNRRFEEIQFEGKRYLTYFSPMVMKRECLRCHSDPKYAPAELIKRYGPKANFHRKLGDVVGLDTIAVPVEAINASLTSEMRSRSMILATVLVLLFGSIVYIFRFVVGKRLVAMANHFDKIAAHGESPWITPVEVKGNDEISVVGIAFNKLVEQLHTTYASLEQRVSERTEELRQANAQLQLELIERKRTEEKLRKSEQKFRLMAETIQDVFWMGNVEKGEMVYVSPAYEQIWGRSRDSLYNSPESFFEAIHPEDRERVAATILGGHSLDSGFDYEYRIIPPDGSTRWIHDRGFPIRSQQGEIQLFTGLASDITERKQSEEALRDNEQFLTDVFNSVQDGMIILSPDFTVIRVNPAAEKLPYVQPLMGRKCYEVIHERSEPCEVCSARQVFQTGQPAEKVHTLKADDGSIIFMEIHAFPLLNRTTGQVDQVIEFARNITGRKRTEEEQLRFSKLESMGILAGGIAHDFNNILTSILGNIGLTILNGKLGGEGIESLVHAEQACFRAQKLSGQLLTFAKGGAPIKKVISLSKLVRESGILALAGSKSRCECSIPEDLWSVEADEAQINQVFNNLLINADQAMPSGGIIKIEAGNTVVEDGSDLPLPEGKYVKLTITDQGFGIPSKYLDKIFDPYFTTKQKGSGLGLATAYSIIKKHSGHIKVESRLGVATAFEIYLPAKEEEPVAILDEQVTPIIAQGRVLVMDDDEKIREVLCRMLRKLGYKADSASDGFQSLEKFVKAKESGRPFDAVILDLTVPGGMGGKETIEKLLRIDPQIKAIVSSGYSDDPIMANFKEYGFSEVIAKPYRVVELGKILQRVISKIG